jgi:calcineurin-like phosphoesterase family protein
MTIYFSSDWHLNEKRIGEFNPFFRPFRSIEEQNRTIIQGINDLVMPDDTLYVVGDVAMDDGGIALLDQIHCKNRTLILGNYDVDKIEKLRTQFEDVREDMELNLSGLECYLNHYPTKARSDRFNIVGHIHGLWKVQPNMVNVSTDAWHFGPVSEKEILFVYNAISKGYYDANVFPGGK